MSKSPVIIPLAVDKQKNDETARKADGQANNVDE